MKLSKYKMVLRIPFLYFIFSAIWIILSDTLVNLLFPDARNAATVQTYKGWGFVVVTSILLLIVLYRELLAHDRDAQHIGMIQTALDETSIRFRTLFESSPIGIAVSDDSSIIYTNPEFAIMFGFSSPEELEGSSLAERIAAGSREDFNQSYSYATQDLLKSVQFEAQGIRKDGSEISLVIQAGKIQAGENSDLVSFFIDSTRQKRTEQDLIYQIEKLSALRSIDTAINFSMELKPVLTTILDQVTTLLKVDAASIFLLKKDSQSLEFAAGKGFSTTEFHRLNITVGDDPAGRVVLTRQTTSIPDLRENPAFENKEAIASEGFLTAYIVPLIAKGLVKGVLQVFHRSLLEPDTVWLDYLETLAGQAAIAIDSSFTYEDLYRSNIEIIRAYEETIEGWSNALDLRDHETEGHTRRVTYLTLQLAGEMGLTPSDLIHIQRGALLHDIGKMGIPDSILLKEGPLTTEERAIIQRHPVYAYELLSPISYLHPAMEIPYCHHEKWDGSGYPRGLQGDMIPLEARIFSVVDVFDALLSNRPYRKGLVLDEVLKFIEDQSSTHFDPEIVRVFLEMVQTRREILLKDYD
ncbi:MAG: HD domain-containing phosphohydrolase [Anaerolineaceae bacterium]